MKWECGDHPLKDKIDPIIYLCLLQADPIVIPSSSRITLARLFSQMGYEAGAEIGVGSGPYSEIICCANPGVHLYCIDAWQPYPEYTDFTDPGHLETDYNNAIKNLVSYDVTFMRKMSADAAREFYSGSLDFVYIDANHNHPYIDEDIENWSRIVRSGGIVSGHDYINGHSHVMQAVDDYVATHNIHPYYLVGTPGEHDNVDKICSWFWMQP